MAVRTDGDRPTNMRDRFAKFAIIVLRPFTRTKTCPRWAFRSRRLWAALRSQNWAVIRKNRPGPHGGEFCEYCESTGGGHSTDRTASSSGKTSSKRPSDGGRGIFANFANGSRGPPEGARRHRPATRRGRCPGAARRVPERSALRSPYLGETQPSVSRTEASAGIRCRYGRGTILGGPRRGGGPSGVARERSPGGCEVQSRRRCSPPYSSPPDRGSSPRNLPAANDRGRRGASIVLWN